MWLFPRLFHECKCDCTLLWRHNGRDRVSNHQPHDCLLNRLFRRKSKKTSKLRVTGLCVGNSPGPMNSPHKGQLRGKCFHLMTSSWNATSWKLTWMIPLGTPASQKLQLFDKKRFSSGAHTNFLNHLFSLSLSPYRLLNFHRKILKFRFHEGIAMSSLRNSGGYMHHWTGLPLAQAITLHRANHHWSK